MFEAFHSVMTSIFWNTSGQGVTFNATFNATMISPLAAGGDQVQLEVTDGWYGVRATIDGPLCHYVASGVLRTGVPILTGFCHHNQCMRLYMSA